MSRIDDYLEAARRFQPPASGTAMSEHIHAGVVRIRRRRRVQVGVAGVVAAGLLVFAWAGGAGRSNVEESGLATIQDDSEASAVPDIRPDPDAGLPLPGRLGRPPSGPPSASAGEPALGPNALVLDGAYELNRSGDGVETPAGILWLRGAAQVIVSQDAVVVHLQHGVAAFQDLGGIVRVDRQTFERPRVRAPNEAEAVRLDAAALAAQAERQIVAGKRKSARATLERLARRYPESEEAATALLDLATLARRGGDEAAAACALKTFLARPGTDPRAATARKQLKRLPTTTCRGLRPAR